MKKNKSPEHSSSVPPADDIILGSVNLQTIQNNVRRFGEKHPADLSTHEMQGQITHDVQGQTTHDVHGQTTHDVQGQTTHDVQGQTNHDVHGQTTHDVHGQTTLEKEPPSNKEDNSLTGLPDLIQQPTKSENAAAHVATDSRHDASMRGECVSGTSSPHARSRSGSSSSSVRSETSTAGSVSAKNSPQHKPDGKGMPAKLADLQDPNTFTLGQGLPEKKRITRSSFGRSNNKGLKESLNVPDDPLSSLDPLWSIEKEAK